MTTTTNTATIEITCGRCGGSGYLRCYANILGGVCFACSGGGTVTVPADYLARQAAAERRRQAAARRRASRGANDALWAEFAAEHPAEAAAIWAGKDTLRTLGTAYSSVATYDRRDSNPEQALRILADEVANGNATI